MTSRNKNIVLVIGFILILFVCYQVAISKTVTLIAETKSLKVQELLFKNTPRELSLLKQKQKYYDSIFNKYQLNGSSIQNNLLKTINFTAKQNNIQIISFLEPHIELKEDLTIKTYQFVIEGDYNDMVHLIYRSEEHTSELQSRPHLVCRLL